MIRYLLPPEGNFYKANLHCHSTESDGHFTPDELIEGYRDHGYSIIAMTDHGKLVDHSHRCTEDFLVLNGFEYNHAPFPLRGRNIHINFIAKDQKNLDQPALDEFGPGAECAGDLEFTAKINKQLKTAGEAGFLPIYNHMRWSHDTEADALGYEGFFAMEVFNYFSEVLGIEEYNVSAFASLIRAGKKIFAVMADDNHNLLEAKHLGLDGLDYWDTSFGGWVQIKAPELKYDTIISALEAGNFYASQGPEIHELYIKDNNTLHISCSPAQSIAVITAERRGRTHWSKTETFTEADFELRGGEDFVIVVITDKNGRHAVSQAYYV